MKESKKEFLALKVLSGIIMIFFLFASLSIILLGGSSYEKFFASMGELLGTKQLFVSSPMFTVILKTLGAFLLMWAFFLFKLFQNPEKNAVIASGSGIGFLIISAITVTHFFSQEIVSSFPPYIIAVRVLVTAILGLLFLVWTPKQ